MSNSVEFAQIDGVNHQLQANFLFKKWEYLTVRKCFLDFHIFLSAFFVALHSSKHFNSIGFNAKSKKFANKIFE